MDGYVPRLKAKYQEEIVPELMNQFEYANVMQVPRLVKISVNKGVGEAATNKKVMDEAVQELRIITGQHPMVRKARKAVSNFKIRQGMPIGASVTLRGERMYEFMDRLVTLACHVFATSVVFLTVPSTGVAITHSASRSKSFFRKSMSTPLARSPVWTSPL